MNVTFNLCLAFGWQGGTIHQVAEYTGCSVDDLLQNPKEFCGHLGSDKSIGWFAYRTCSQGWNIENFIKDKRGNIAFWMGVAEGVETTRKLGEPIVAKF